jgi:DNA/RNA endonuclease G (NUC1)
VANFRRSLEILKYGEPVSLSPQRLYYANHVLEFDPQKRTPKWVAEHITRDHVEPVSEVGHS